jgi:hypothetical protein
MPDDAVNYFGAVFIVFIFLLVICSLAYYGYGYYSPIEGTYLDEYSKRPIVIVNTGRQTLLSDGDNSLHYSRRFGKRYFGGYRVKNRDGLMCLMDGSNCVMALRRDDRFKVRRH